MRVDPNGFYVRDGAAFNLVRVGGDEEFTTRPDEMVEKYNKADTEDILGMTVVSLTPR